MKRKSKKHSEVDFALEDHLLPILKKTVPQLIAPKNCDVVLNFTKLQVGMIIPDLVVIAAPKNLHKRLNRQKPPSLFECAILAELLKRGPRSKRQLAKEFYARMPTLNKAIAKLKSYKLVSINKNDRLAANKAAFPLSVKIISIEAKLRRWKEAILQAEEYLHFSNFSYVALPEPIIKSNSRIQTTCRKRRIGLIAVKRNSTDIIVRAKSTRPLNPAWVWLMRKTACVKNVRRVPIKAYSSQPSPDDTKKLSNALSHEA